VRGRLLAHDRQTESTTFGFDPASRDVTSVLAHSSYYDLAGGLGFFQLFGRFQQHLDLSDILAGGRAVLVARVDASATRVKCDNGFATDPPPKGPDEGARTLVRFVIPVTVGEFEEPPDDPRQLPFDSWFDSYRD